MDSLAAARQAFGSRYEATKQDQMLAQQLKDRRLIMSPHAEWEIPKVPTWTEDPFKDSNWQFQYHALRWLDPLRRVALKGDTQARDLWEFYVKSWLRSNPVGNSPTRWAWIDMGDALRTYELTFALPLFPEEPEWLTTALHQHAAYLSEDANIGRGNHALHQHQALFTVARALESERYLQIATDRISAQIQVAYDENGLNEEGSIAYHEANFHWWNEALKRFDVENLPRPEGSERIALAPETLAYATRPDGYYVRIGDTDTGRPNKIKSPYTRYVSTNGNEGSPPQDLIKIFDQGYVYGRSGWGDDERDFSQHTFFSICFGSQRKIHGHMDGGSLTFYANEQRWLIGTGRFVYGRHPVRTYVVGRSGHNLLRIKDSVYDRNSKVTLFRNHESVRHLEIVTRDTGYEDVLITRRVIYSKRGEYLIVLDGVSAKKSVEVEQRWHLASDVDSRFEGKVVHLSSAKAKNRIEWVGVTGNLSSVRGSQRPFEGWSATGWRKHEATTLLKAVQTGSQVSFRTVIGAYDTERQSEIVFRSLPGGYKEYTVPTKLGVEYVLVGKHRSEISDVPFGADTIERSGAPTGVSLLSN